MAEPLIQAYEAPFREALANIETVRMAKTTQATQITQSLGEDIRRLLTCQYCSRSERHENIMQALPNGAIKRRSEQRCSMISAVVEDCMAYP